MFVRFFKPVLLLLLAAAFYAAPARAADSLCGQPPRPVIEVVVDAAPVAFDTKKTREELAQLEINTASPWPQAYHTMVGGVMQGRISADHKITFNRLSDKDSGTGCVWFDKIQIILRIDPKIYIAGELRNNSCWFREVFAHEAKHVEEDHALMGKFGAQIGDGLKMSFAAPADYISGNVPLVVIDAIQKRMESDVTQILTVMFEMMMRERAQRQQAVDSLGEYTLISSRC